jgi:hypothetical protein
LEGEAVERSWNRFAGLGTWPARGLLALLLALIALAALTPITVGRGEQAKPPAIGAAPVKQTRFDDLRLYDAVIARIQRGEGYYAVVVEEHRKLPFPVKPGFAVRLPTLAYLAAWLGPQGLMGASILLFAAIALAWWRRLADEPGGLEHRPVFMALLLLGSSFVFVRYFHVLHELWAGALLALAFGLHRPSKRWLGALAVAALALAIRETALPFVLLMAAMAGWRRDWREAAAWMALAVVFVALWAWHLHLIAAQVLPTDPPSASWLTLRGLSGWLSLSILPTPLRFLPAWLAGPVVVLALLGWSAWRSAAGSFGALLLLGYGVAFMIAGRPENWYWGALVTPVLVAGLAFVPGALAALLRKSSPKRGGGPA